MDPLRISLVQFDISWEDAVANRSKLDHLLDPKTGTTDLVLLPEMFTTGFSMNARNLSEKMDGISVEWMLQKASAIGAAIAGSLIIRENNHYFNRFLFVTPGGEIFSYDKRHLFSIGGENQYFEPGNKRVVVDYLGWKIALYICYDLRFPVWSRSVLEADLLLFTANWPLNRKIVWETLLRARSIENQAYTAGVSRTGRDGSGVDYFGGSMVINPKGEMVLGLKGSTDTVETTTISLSQLNSFRKKFPVHLDADSFRITD